MAPGRYLADQDRPGAFTYHGKPVSPQDVAHLLRHRLNWRRIQLQLQRDRDEREGTILHQLLMMFRGRDA